MPVGLGLDSDRVRQRMVDRLRTQGVRHEAVLAAMGAVPRHRFVDSALAIQAHEDTSLPIGATVRQMVEWVGWDDQGRVAAPTATRS